jgi:hypothetical protein
VSDPIPYSSDDIRVDDVTGLPTLTFDGSGVGQPVVTVRLLPDAARRLGRLLTAVCDAQADGPPVWTEQPPCPADAVWFGSEHVGPSSGDALRVETSAPESPLFVGNATAGPPSAAPPLHGFVPADPPGTIHWIPTFPPPDPPLRVTIEMGGTLHWRFEGPGSARLIEADGAAAIVVTPRRPDGTEADPSAAIVRLTTLPADIDGLVAEAEGGLDGNVTGEDVRRAKAAIRELARLATRTP